MSGSGIEISPGSWPQFRILGNLEAESGSGLIRLGGPCEHKLLAVLLLDAGHAVPLTRLIDALWDDHPPASACKLARNAVSRLRRSLSDGGAPGLIHTDGSGYRAVIDSQALDALVFDAMVTRAEVASGVGKTAEAAALLRSALGLWRGPFLADLHNQIACAAGAAWQEKRCAAIETFHDHQLALGRHREIIAELRIFTAEHPWREHSIAQLLLALYRSGRRVDALDAYATFRKHLTREVGLDPGQDLQMLQKRILVADPALDPPELTRTE
jgi:DNA-binding SARP family transcriptional activator